MKTAQHNSERVKKVNTDYTNYLITKGVSKNTLVSYERDLEALAKWFTETTGESFSPVRITSIDLREYQGYLRRLGRKPATINRHLQSIRGWLSWHVNEKLISHIPTFPKGIAEVPKAPQALTTLFWSHLRCSETAINRGFQGSSKIFLPQ